MGWSPRVIGWRLGAAVLKSYTKTDSAVNLQSEAYEVAVLVNADLLILHRRIVPRTSTSASTFPAHASTCPTGLKPGNSGRWVRHLTSSSINGRFLHGSKFDSDCSNPVINTTGTTTVLLL